MNSGDHKADDQREYPPEHIQEARVAPRRIRWLRVFILGLLGAVAISFVTVVRHPHFREIRAAWLAERPLADQFRRGGCRFNEVIWWTPENGESFAFSSAYKYYRQVQHIRFTKPDVNGLPFARLREFEHLESIDLSDTYVRADHLTEMCNRNWAQIDLCRTVLTRAGVQSLVTTNRLQNLSLAGSSVTDGMLSALATLRVHNLSLADTQVGDVGMDPVGKMPLLTSLDLARTKVGDKGLESLSQRTFSDLDLSGTAVTDAGLSNLNLRSPGFHLDLNLSNTRISDGGLAVFKRLKFVQELNLSNTQITDAGLEHLNEQSYLRKLYLGGTKVTPAGIGALLRVRQASKDAWKDEFAKRRAERARGMPVAPPDLVIIVDRTRTNSPAAYPTAH